VGNIEIVSSDDILHVELPPAGDSGVDEHAWQLGKRLHQLDRKPAHPVVRTQDNRLVVASYLLSLSYPFPHERSFRSAATPPGRLDSALSTEPPTSPRVSLRLVWRYRGVSREAHSNKSRAFWNLTLAPVKPQLYLAHKCTNAQQGK
jgi:hypothetical protein